MFKYLNIAFRFLNIVFGFLNIVFKYSAIVFEYRNIVFGFLNIVFGFLNIVLEYRNIVLRFFNVVFGFLDLVVGFPNIVFQFLNRLSALGQPGALLNQPTEEFSKAIDSNRFSSTTMRRSRQPSLLPSLLDGFFTTTAQRLNQRSEQQTQDLIKRSTLAIVPVGTEVSVVINSFFRVNR
ncbi:MAG: hypothetical protein KME42_24160 [Tildeniella nuda ZEHNDER 1965/U140]|jgi:hypothetical protein|nr:hypothetical protein [Tildeniella nuda ZEHNDER 1965/U140]